MIFSLKMAWAYFKRIFSMGMLGVMVLISIMGVALGVASLVVTISVMNGFHSEITSKLLSLTPHIIIMNPFLGIEIEDEINGVLNEFPEVKSRSPFVYGKALLYNERKSQGIVVKGISPQSLSQPLLKGNWIELLDDSIVLGNELTNIIGADTGDEIYLVIPRLTHITAPLIPRVEKFVVSGIFSSGLYEYDSGLAYINIKRAASIFSDDFVSRGVEIYLDNPFNADKNALLLKDKLAASYTVRTWKEKNYNLFAALKLEKTMIFLVLIMITIVAAFNIVGSLIMVSQTRSKDVGILRALGATKNQIRMMFNFKGLFMGITGALLGTLAGVAISLLLAKYKFIELPPQVYLIDTLPVRINPQDIIIIIAVAILISFLASLYPSYRAGKMEVAQELRYE